MKHGVRAIAICVFWKNESIFVFEARDEVKGEIFYRPLGGMIEFGEYSSDTVKREIQEEIGEVIQNIRYLGTLENIFHYEGELGHEIVIVYTADFADKAIYDQIEVTGYEDIGATFRAVWKDLAFFRDSHAPLYPDGLLELLTDSQKGTR